MASYILHESIDEITSPLLILLHLVLVKQAAGFHMIESSMMITFIIHGNCDWIGYNLTCIKHSYGKMISTSL